MRGLSAAGLVCLLLAGCAASVDPKGKAHDIAAGYAEHVGVRPSLARAVVHWESRGNMHAKAATSSATGAMQVIDGTAAAIAGRHVPRAERKTVTGIKIGVAYLAACQQAMPSAGDRQVWRSCYYYGHGAVGADIRVAQLAFQKLEGK